MDELEELLALAEKADIKVSQEKLAELSERCNQLVEIRDSIAKAEDILKEMKKQEQEISGGHIPSLMSELGVAKIVLESGQSVSCRPFYSGKIRPEAEDLAFQWLEDTGHGGIVKGAITVPYRRSNREEALEVSKALKENGWDVSAKLSVHHSSLRALFKELVENEGITPPPDLFDLFIGNKTTIK